jgi:hypothetical protein
VLHDRPARATVLDFTQQIGFVLRNHFGTVPNFSAYHGEGLTMEMVQPHLAEAARHRQLRRGPL